MVGRTGEEEENTDDTSEAKETLRSGLASVLDDNFSVSQAVGGVRGAIESVLPGLAFVVAFVITRDLLLTVIISGAIALLELLIRLVSHQQIRSAFVGVLSIAICLVWAWLSKDAKNYYLPGFITNVVYGVVLLITIIIKVPGIGVLVEIIHTPISQGGRAWLKQWRSDPKLLKAYTLTTWVWVAMFILRLGVQVPLYLIDSVAYLGTARLVMGVPLMALCIWISWILISPQVKRVDAQNAEAENSVETEKNTSTQYKNATSETANPTP